MTVEIWWVGW